MAPLPLVAPTTVELIAMGNHESLLLTVRQAAALASVSLTTAYRYVHDGTWPRVAIGRGVRVPRRGLESWIESETKGGAEVVSAGPR